MKTYTTLTILTILLAPAMPVLGQAQPQIQINTKVLSVPLDAAALREAGLSFDAGDSVSNLGVIPADKAAATLAKLEKMAGFSLLNAPSVTTKSGQRCTAESVREFIYPSEYSTARFSQSLDGKPVQLSPGQGISAAPSLPESFQMRPTGFRLEAEPMLAQDGTTIEMNLAPELVNFAGFVNYSSPIKAVVADKDSKAQEVVLTENQVLQPVFDVVKTRTAARIPSGHVLVLGGANGGALPSATSKPDLKQEAKLEGKPSHAVFFFIQAKVFTP
jgi:general secretion pathway protein D